MPFFWGCPTPVSGNALDKSPDDASRAALLRRVNAGSYDRLEPQP
jgi:hypothetical protein